MRLTAACFASFPLAQSPLQPTCRPYELEVVCEQTRVQPGTSKVEIKRFVCGGKKNLEFADMQIGEKKT